MPPQPRYIKTCNVAHALIYNVRTVRDAIEELSAEESGIGQGESLGRDCNWNENSSSASDRNVDEAPPRDAEGCEGIAKTNVSGEAKPPTPKDGNLNGSDQVAPK